MEAGCHCFFFFFFNLLTPEVHVMCLRHHVKTYSSGLGGQLEMVTAAMLHHVRSVCISHEGEPTEYYFLIDCNDGN